MPDFSLNFTSVLTMGKPQEFSDFRAAGVSMYPRLVHTNIREYGIIKVQFFIEGKGLFEDLVDCTEIDRLAQQWVMGKLQAVRYSLIHRTSVVRMMGVYTGAIPKKLKGRDQVSHFTFVGSLTGARVWA